MIDRVDRVIVREATDHEQRAALAAYIAGGMMGIALRGIMEEYTRETKALRRSCVKTAALAAFGGFLAVALVMYHAMYRGSLFWFVFNMVLVAVNTFVVVGSIGTIRRCNRRLIAGSTVVSGLFDDRVSEGEGSSVVP